MPVQLTRLFILQVKEYSDRHLSAREIARRMHVHVSLVEQVLCTVSSVG